MPAQRGRIIAGTPRTLVKKGSNAKLIGCPTTKAVKQPPSPARDSTTSKARGSSKGSRGTSKAETHHDHGSEVHYHIHGDLYNDIQAASKAVSIGRGSRGAQVIPAAHADARLISFARHQRQQKADSSPTKKKAGGGGAPRGSKVRTSPS